MRRKKPPFQIVAGGVFNFFRGGGKSVVYHAGYGYAAALAYLKPGTPAGARNALRVTWILEELQLPTGEDFDRVAAETNPSGAELSETDLLGLLKQGDPALPAGSVSRLLENQEAYFLIKVKSKTPGRYIPLKDAAPYLRLQLRSEKTAKALETILRGELKKANVQFFIDQ